MPRHRRESRPRHRAQRRAPRSGADVAPAAPAARRPAAAADQAARAGQTGVTWFSRARWTRGVFVTPWFVVGAGLVIAAFVALRSPHPVLTFAQPDQHNCSHKGCSPGRPGSLASGKPGVRIRLPEPRRSGHPAAAPQRRFAPPATPSPSAPPPGPRHPGTRGGRDVTVGFQLFRHGYWHSQPSFAAFITLHSGKQLGAWRLRFVLPGTHIDRVWGAIWRESAAGDGGVATGQPWPWPHSDNEMFRIAIMGTGTPGQPTGCVFDRIACTFTDHHDFG
jgi:hypothetical protein